MSLSYLPTTKVWTVNGLKTIDEITVNDRVYTLQNDNVIPVKVESVKANYYHGMATCIHNTELNLTIFDDIDNCVFYRGGHFVNYNVDEPSYIEIDSVPIWDNYFIPQNPLPKSLFFKFLGMWFISGKAEKIPTTHKFTIVHYSNDVLHKAEELCKKMNLKYGIKLGQHVVIKVAPIKFFMENHLLGEDKDDFIIPPFIKNSTAEHIKNFVEGLYMGKDVEYGGSLNFSTLKLAEQVWECFRKIDLPANIKKNASTIYTVIPGEKEVSFIKSPEFLKRYNYEGNIYSLILEGEYNSFFRMEEGYGCWAKI
jgi:hypothetical protein